jgi:transposase InsO family protein
MATVVRYDDEVTNHDLEQEQLLSLPILGEKGVQELIRQYEYRVSVQEGTELPTSDREWTRVQEAEWGEDWKPEAGDLDYREIFLKLKEGGVHTITGKSSKSSLVLSRSQVVTEEDGVQVMEMGPLKRDVIWSHETKSQHTPVTISRRGQVIMVPLRYRKQCMSQAHEYLGHPGQKRMLKTLGTRYHWLHIRKDVNDYVGQCHYCGSRKVYFAHAKPPVQAYDWPSRPFCRAHMDITELNTSARGYRYVLAVKDALTKWVELIPLRDKHADTVITALINWVVLRHGVIMTLVTDRGSENCNSIMSDITKVLGCRHIATTPNNPRSDGLIENQMKTIKDQLAAFVNKFHNDWDIHLQKVAHGYRTTVNDATGYSPFFMNCGRECNQPMEEHLLSLNAEDHEEKLENFGEDLRNSMVAAWEISSERVVKNTTTFNRVPRRHLVFEPYKVGQFIFIRAVPKRFFSEGYKLKKHKLNSKLQYRYVGPFRILKRFSDVLYEADIHNKPTRIHAVNMKPA